MASSLDPLVSIVVPVLNGEQHIKQCIQSIIDQSYENFEIIVSINASQDSTAEIVRSFADPRVRILPELTQLLSLHENWARALSGARGEWVKMVCHDDLLLPDCLAVQTELLKLYPGAALASGRRRIIDDNGEVIMRARGLGGLTDSIGTKNLRASEIARACVRAGTNLLGEPASVMIRRSALPNPLFDSHRRFTIDIELYMRCLKDGDAIVDNRVVSCFRVSQKQLSAAVVGEQVVELRAFFAEMIRLHPDSVTDRDVRIGILRAWLLTTARRVLYSKMKLYSRLFRS